MPTEYVDQFKFKFKRSFFFTKKDAFVNLNQNDDTKLHVRDTNPILAIQNDTLLIQIQFKYSVEKK